MPHKKKNPKLPDIITNTHAKIGFATSEYLCRR